MLLKVFILVGALLAEAVAGGSGPPQALDIQGCREFVF
jgi:hypothetical protein